jgi:hypothetical protein
MRAIGRELVDVVMNDYTQQWTQYKRLRNRILLMLLISSPCYFALSIFVEIALIHSKVWVSAAINSILSAVMLAVYIWMYWSVRKWPCPRCGQRFYSYSERHGLGFFTKNCWHCGLAKYSNGEETEVPPT